MAYEVLEPDYLGNPNVSRFLNMIGMSEGTVKPGVDAYRVGFGGSDIADLSAHPNIRVPFTQTDGRENVTTAAGKYQFLKGTWDDVSRKLGLQDFSPRSQDLAAIELLRRNGALQDVVKGDFNAAIKKSGSTWASLPSSPYAQPKRSAGFVARALDAAIPSAQADTPMATGRYEILDDAPQGRYEVLAPGDQAAAPRPTPVAPQNGAVANFGKGAAQAVKQDLVAGPAQFIGKAVQGAIGMIPGIKDTDYWRGIQQNSANMDRLMRQDEAQYQAETPGSVAAGAGRVLANVGGGLAVGGGGLINAGTKLGRTGAGLLGVSEKAGGLLGKVAGSSALGGLFSAMAPVNQEGDYWDQKAGQIKTGMAVGGTLPLATTATRAALTGAGKVAGKVGGSVSPEVAALGREAQDLGIQLRPDQISTSKPIRTLSSVLDNIPFSGKQGSLIRQQKQFNTAVSRTMGENTDNVIQAIKNADTRLGGEFDRVLKSTAVKADTIFQDDLSRIMGDALRETNDQQFSVLSRQADYLLSKVRAGDVIDGDAAYNVKKGLDRLGKSNDTTLAFYARELRGSLMDALNRSLPDGGKEFARTRQQWANKMELEKLIGHGAEGDISAARLANLRNSRSKDLNKLSDISAQFLRSTTPDSGTAQRGAMTGGFLGGLFAKPLTIGAGLTAGRGLNMLLGSPRIANAMLNGSVPPPILNGGAALTANAIPQTLMGRLTPYLLPAGTIAGSTAFAKP